MKTLITGASGFIGSHVTRQLLEEGETEVRALVLPNDNLTNLEGLDIELVEGDVTDRESIRKAVDGCDRVFHMGAIYAVWTPNERKVYDVNVEGTWNVLHEAREAGVERVVHTSSIGAVGIKEGKQLADETTAFDKWEDKNIYVISKFESERVAMRFAEEGFPVVCVNPAFPFGTRDIRPTPTGDIMMKIVQGKFPGYFDGGVNVIDVADVARGHLLAMKKGRVGERYILGHRNLTMEEFFQLVARVAGVSFRRLKIPYPVMAGYAIVAETIANRWTHEEPLTTYRSVKYARNYLYYDNSKAVNELGLTFTPIEEAIQKALDWWERHGYLDN